MLIFNPSGDPINVITGNHLPGHSHDDVIHINSMGLSLNVPPIICSTFQNLEKMELDYLGIITLANNPFENCGSLKELSLNKNNLGALYPNLFTNTVLEELYLEDNAFNEVTAEQLTDLDNLKTLSFKGNGQTSFTGSVFEHLPNLEYLDLSACNFTEIKTEWFANGLSKLQVLNLADNFLEEIPANTFNALTVLEILALDNNQISTLNGDSFELPALKALFLDANKLDDLQANVFRHLARLEILYLSENDCSNLPGNIFSSIPTLTTLAMHACSIETIKPEWFQAIPNLSILLLEENNIKEFPERTFQSTNNLKFLSVYGNQLTELNSRSFGSVVSLTHLDVRSNQINGIEHHLIDLMNDIRVVLLSENLCANFDTLSYDLRSDEYKERLKSCFDNFDKTPIVLETDNTASFEWYTIRTNERWTFIEFNVTAPGYVHIALTDASNNGALLEIRVGEESNTQLQIFERGERKIARNEADLLNGIFKINLGLSFITFYKNSSQIPFYGYFIENYFPVKFFGLRTQIPPTGSINKISWEVQRIQS